MQHFSGSQSLAITGKILTRIARKYISKSDTKKLGRISSKTIGTFLITTVCALIWAGIIGSIVYHLGAFNAVHADNLLIQQGAVGSNPLNIIVSVIPNNLINAFTNNGNVLAVVFLAVAIGLAMNQLKDKTKTLKKLIN